MNNVVSPLKTRRQQLAERAFAAVQQTRTELKPGTFNEYVSIAKAFPALLHTSGLCQATAFAESKKGSHLTVLEDVTTTLNLAGVKTAHDLAGNARSSSVADYMQLSRHALDAATWIKRYAEALSMEETTHVD